MQAHQAYAELSQSLNSVLGFNLVKGNLPVAKGGFKLKCGRNIILGAKWLSKISTNEKGLLTERRILEHAI